MNSVTQAAYRGDGPVLPGETVHQAMGMNAVYSIGGHLLNRSIQGVSSGPRPIEYEPTDAAEKSSFMTAQNATRSASGDLESGVQDGAPALTDALHVHAGQVRSALRLGT
jgi:hypothetical protein